MSEQKERRTLIRSFIINDAEKRGEMLGEERSLVEKIVSNGQSLVDSGLYDSLSFLDLLTTLENEFDIEIDMTGYDLEYFLTLDGLSIVAAEADSKKITEEKSKTESSKSAQGISFEQITPQHPNWKDLILLFDSLYEYLERFNLLVKPKPNGGALWLKSLENVVGKTNVIIGAIDEGKIVGYFHAGLKILPVYLEGGFVGILMSMFVQPEYRKQNVADDMYQEVYKWLVAQNVSSIETQPMFNNQRMVDYWHSRGYEKEIVQLRKIIKL